MITRYADRLKISIDQTKCIKRFNDLKTLLEKYNIDKERIAEQVVLHSQLDDTIVNT